MKILFVASECAPIAKAGGLGDVVGSLPKAINGPGFDVSVVIPFYEKIRIKKRELKLVIKNIPVMFEQKKEKFNLWKIFLPQSNVCPYLIESKKYFSEKGINISSDASSEGSRKEAVRFLFLSAASIEAAKFIKPDILHCHDWHTAIIPSLLKEKCLKIKTLLTIHNLAYQGIYSAETINKLLGIDYSREVNCLKEGILNADYINTVSLSYSLEILTPQFGCGLENSLQKRKKRLTGIINGLDESHFNPENDPLIKEKYSRQNIERKIADKIYLQKKYFKKANPEIPLLAVVSRLAGQKGVDLIMEIFPTLMNKNIQFILLGEGIRDYENFFLKASRDFPGKFRAEIGFNEKLAHQIYAGADIFLMPSAFEPCGLGQLIAMKYGTVPVARAIGGIKDTVLPVKITEGKAEGTGFLFQDYSSGDFLKLLENALDLYNNKKDVWKQVQINGMKQDFSWKKSSKKYKSLYEKIMKYR